MPPTVVIVGGGYGGVAAARALDDETDVILVEPRDAFVHNVAALRGLVDPAWADRIFMPYRRLLDRGQVIRDRVVAADATGVTLGSGEKLTADYLVLATGSAYPFPGKTGEDESAVARSRPGRPRGPRRGGRRPAARCWTGGAGIRRRDQVRVAGQGGHHRRPGGRRAVR